MFQVAAFSVTVSPGPLPGTWHGPALDQTRRSARDPAVSVANGAGALDANVIVTLVRSGQPIANRPEPLHVTVS